MRIQLLVCLVGRTITTYTIMSFYSMLPQRTEICPCQGTYATKSEEGPDTWVWIWQKAPSRRFTFFSIVIGAKGR
jgi:hypothetical protein